MPTSRKPEFKTRLASVLWDAVEECVQRFDAENVSEKPSETESPAGEGHQFDCCSKIKHIPVGPTPKEDSIDKDWRTMLQPIQKDDQEQCQSWNQEVQNILIFAALFSAVVTAFLIESYQLLQTGRQDVTTNATPPLSSSIRIKVFWFLSLVLSLTTALIGIITAQWLREHLSYPEYLTPEQVFAILNMKTSMLKKWRVRGIISSLSVLLQISLLLFFAGLIQFLFSLEVNAVTIPVTALIGLSGLFPMVTTVLPALHIYVWQKETIVGGDVPVPCPYKSPQAELFYAFAIFLSNHRPFPQLFSLVYGFLMFIPTALVTIAVLTNFYLHRIFFPEGNSANLGTVLAVLIGKPVSLFFKVIKGFSTAVDSVLHFLYEVRTSVRGITPIHYDRAMALFRPAMKDESEYWWAFDVAWVSIRRDYAFRLYASRAWRRNINADRHYIMQEWKKGENDPPMVWGKAISREANARAGPPWDQIQGLILLRRQYQHNDSDWSIMEAALRCFKASVSSFRGYDKVDNNRPEVNSWMTGFEDATTEILRPHVREEVTFANFSHFINPRGSGVTLCTASVYHEALFHFMGDFHLEKLADKGEIRLKTAWVEIYYKLVRCLPSSEDLQYISAPFAFATCSRNVSAVTFRFSHEEETDIHRIYLEKARSCARRLDKYRAKGAAASDNLRNQVLHDFFFAIGAAPFYARQDTIPADIQRLVSSLSTFCQYLERRDNPDLINMAHRIEAALGDTVDNYFEDSQIAFKQVAGPSLNYGVFNNQVHMTMPQRTDESMAPPGRPQVPVMPQPPLQPQPPVWEPQTTWEPQGVRPHSPVRPAPPEWEPPHARPQRLVRARPPARPYSPERPPPPVRPPSPVWQPSTVSGPLPPVTPGPWPVTVAPPLVWEPSTVSWVPPVERPPSPVWQPSTVSEAPPVRPQHIVRPQQNVRTQHIVRTQSPIRQQSSARQQVSVRPPSPDYPVMEDEPPPGTFITRTSSRRHY